MGNDALTITRRLAGDQPGPPQSRPFSIAIEPARRDLVGAENEDQVEIELGPDVTPG